MEKKSDEESDEESDTLEAIDTADMPDLESEESATQRTNQQVWGLKILTPNQMPIYQFL